MTFISHAQNYEDVILWRALKHVSSGFYIDIGAAWPDKDSVTKAFYERGWYGINIEPNPNLFSELVSKRPRDINLALAISSQGSTAEMSVIKGTGLSTLDRSIAKQHLDQGWLCTQITVDVKTLSSIWEDYVPQDQEVHFLKVDVEGLEQAVLESNNWKNYRPWIVVVESTLPSSQIESHETWQSKLLAAQYSLVYADGLNRFYLANEHFNLASSFVYPPNVFDRFQLVSQHKAEAELSRAKDLNQQLQEQIQHLEEQNRQVRLDLYLLANSRSMRITKPLRLLLNLARKLRSWIRDQSLKHSKKKVGKKNFFFIEELSANVFTSLIYHSCKKFLSNILIATYRNPRVNRITRGFVRKVPKLESALRRIYTKTIYSVSEQETDIYPKDLSYLSPTTRRVYSDLKKMIDKYHGGNY